MQKSTKVFLIILSILIFTGLGGVLILYAIMLGVSRDDVETTGGYGDRVAVVELVGPIVSSDATVRLFKKYREDNSVRAIVLRVESPGGGVVASQEIYEEVRKTRSLGIPVVVSMGSVAASGGYYVACGGSKIMANPGTLTGSIGVISQLMRYDPLLDKIGVSVTTIKSGKMKDAGNPYRAVTDEDKQYFQKLMDAVHAQFVDVVEKERNLEHGKIVELADGRVFTGVDALEAGLVDSLGTYEDAVRLAAEMGGIRGEPSILRERKRRTSVFDFLTGTSEISELMKLKEELLGQPILQYKMAPGF